MKKELTDYNFPEDLKTMDKNELEILSYGIRDFLIQNISKTGGHIAPNLGVVELTIGLHKVFDSPKDRIIWDVGHQSYVHKILTGRAKNFESLRQTNGMSGFPKSNESPHDIYETGHASTSVSAAAGMAFARDLKKENYNIIAVIGDGALTGGMAYEALNNIGASHSKVIVILNDNGMSISPNIGGLSNHLNRLRSSKSYLDTKKSVKKNINKIPYVGKELSSGIAAAKDKFKYAIISNGIIFEELGFTYLGPIDGHKIDDVISILESGKNINGPVLIHVITKKGKGYYNAEMNPDKFHGIGPFDINTGKPLKSSKTSYSQAMGQALLEEGKKNEKIVAITAAMESATGLSPFKKAFPKRCFDVGIAEAHAVAFSAGLAKNGLHPCVAIYSTFLQRAYDQIIEDVCLQNLPVLFAIDRAGIVGADGETHHGIMDISYLLSIPNMKILTPGTGNQLQAMIEYGFKINGPVAIRYPRGECDLTKEKEYYSGGNKRLFNGKDGDIWAVGPMWEFAVNARNILAEKNMDYGVVMVNSVKPIDLTLFDEKCTNLITVEDGMSIGGFGQYMRANISQNHKVLNLGWPDNFIEHGSQNDLYKKYKLDGEGIAERIIDYFERKA